MRVTEVWKERRWRREERRLRGGRDREGTGQRDCAIACPAGAWGDG